jgi:succinyl-CoA synthetase alpha subunit
MSSTGIPSVIAIITLIPALAASIIASAAKAGGTKIILTSAPAGRTMGHAGAIVGGEDDTAEAKKAILRACGVHVVDSPAEIGKKMAEVLGVTA